MKRRCLTFAYFPVVAIALSVMIGSTISAHALPTGALVVGEIERMGVNDPADPWSAGWIVVGKDNVIIPRNLLIELPANRLTLQQLFVPTVGNPVSGPPAACFANGESGLAKVDRCNARVLGATATIYANRMDSGHVIAGDVRLAKANESITGVVTYINYTDGYFRVNGIPNPGSVDDNTGTMVRFNDPGPLNNPGKGRHTIQQGFGCLIGSLNCSADPRFTNDPENYTITFQTGFPVCIPSTANGVGDPNCPSTNRPTPVVSPPVVNPIFTPALPPAFPFVSPQLVPGGTVANSQHFAPILLGDSLTAFGNYELIPGVFTGAQFFSAHTAQVFADLATRDDPTQPDYTILREVGWDSPPFPAARVRLLFIGNSTLHGLTLGAKGGVTDPDTAVDIYASHYDQSNVAHNSPGDGMPVYSTVGFKKGAVAFGGVSIGIFQIHPGLQVELDPGIMDKKLLLDPCSSLLDAIDTVANPGPPTPPLFLADVQARCATPQSTGQFGVLEAYKFVAPIAKEGVAYTRHKQRNPGLASFDKNGNPTPNGKYLSPIPTEWAGYEDINIGLMQAPFSFSGIPWLLDRRVGPNGCIGPCEGTPQPLTPFPFEGFNPKEVSLRPSKASAAFGVPQPDQIGLAGVDNTTGTRIFQFWPFGAANQLAWDNAALTALATTGLPPITPVPNLAFQVTVLPPPPVTGVTLTVSPTSPRIAGTQVLFLAAAAGGSGTYEYQFSQNVGGVLTVAQPYGPSPGWLWNTTGLAAATYNFQVDARSAGSVNASEASAVASYTILPTAATGVTITPAPASPQPPGASVAFVGAASGGSGTYEYQFSDNVTGAMAVTRAYSQASAWIWNTTGVANGTYSIKVDARYLGSTAASEATATTTFTLAPAPVASVAYATLTANPASPGPARTGDNVVLTAQAYGGSGTYEYRFWLMPEATGVFAIVQDYSSSPTWTWNTTGIAAGNYLIAVHSRNVGSTAFSEAGNTTPYSVNGVLSGLTLSANLSDPRPAGDNVVFTAAASGGTGSYEYRFWLYSGGTWSVVQAYSSNPTWTWNTAGVAPGSYLIAVHARNAGSTAFSELGTTTTFTLQ